MIALGCIVSQTSVICHSTSHLSSHLFEFASVLKLHFEKCSLSSVTAANQLCCLHIDVLHCNFLARIFFMLMN